MPASRRRFLAGVTALATSVAGCNESAPREIAETVTPVDVPRSNEEVLREAASIETPSVPSPDVVTDPHYESAIAHLERLHRELIDRLDARDQSSDFGEYVGLPDTPEALVENVGQRLADARERDPSRDALGTVRQGVGEAATGVGYLRAESGDLDAATLREALADERAALAALRESLEYRLAAPVGEALTRAHAGETTLDRIDDPEMVVKRLRDVESYDDRRREQELAAVYHRLELGRRRRDDAEWYFEAATDPDAPSRRDAIDAEIDAATDVLRSVVEGRPTGSPASTETVVGDLRGIRRNVFERAQRTLQERATTPEDGRRVRGLVEVTRRVVEARAIDTGVERTLDRLDGESLDAAALPAEKRRAVERLQRAAESGALQRQLAATAERILSSADRVPEDESVDRRRLARTHFLYAAAGEWAEGALERGDALAEALQAQQS